MLKKLTNKKNNKMKREFRERKAQDNCHYPCFVICEGINELYYPYRFSLELN
jgi:hypothetical protein